VLTLPDVHRATDHASQGWRRVSPSRGKLEFLFSRRLLTIGQGGIVFDSDPHDEWMETINKLGASVSCSHDATTRRRLTASCDTQGRTHSASPQLKRSISPSRRSTKATAIRWRETQIRACHLWLGSLRHRGCAWLDRESRRSQTQGWAWARWICTSAGVKLGTFTKWATSTAACRPLMGLMNGYEQTTGRHWRERS